MGNNIETKKPYEPFDKIPGPKERFLFGSAGMFEPDKFHKYLETLGKEFSPIFKVHFFGKPLVVIFDAETVQFILKNRPGRFRRASRIEPVFKELGVQGAFSEEGDEWSRHRKLLNPAFNPSQIKKFFPTLVKLTNRLCGSLDRDGNNLDFQTLIHRYAVDVTTNLAFGYDLNVIEDTDSDLQKNISLVFPRIAARLKSPIPYWRYLKLDVDKKVDKAIVEIQKSVQEFIAAARIRLKNGNEPDNILESLLTDAAGAKENDIFGNVIQLLLAGEDTTANTIAWTIDYLSKDLALQERIAQEICKNYPSDKELEWEDLTSFPLIDGAIQEALRLKPVAPFLQLEGYQDEILCGYSIPKGTTIIGMLASEGLSSDSFEEPHKFDPERWIKMSDQDRKKCNKSLAPFGAGPRLCPGMQLAYSEMRLTLIELLRRYKFSYSNPATQKTGESFEFTVKPTGLIVNAVQRKPNNSQNRQKYKHRQTQETHTV